MRARQTRVRTSDAREACAVALARHVYFARSRLLPKLETTRSQDLQTMLASLKSCLDHVLFIRWGINNARLLQDSDLIA